MTLFSCTAKKISVVESTEFNSETNSTQHFVLPLGTVSIPGNWKKTKHNDVSHQQFFTNKDLISIAIAFTRFDDYEFNLNKSKKGIEFVNAYYEWDSKYLANKYGYTRTIIEKNEEENFIIWRLHSSKKSVNIDNYYLFGEKNGNVSNFSVEYTEKWTSEKKISFLKDLYLAKD